MSAFPVKFGKYLLLERVNVGGMAEVFKAKTFGVAGFERILAVKRILPNLVEDEEFIRMFIDEARIAVQLNHTNIVQIYELGKHGEHYYIAMEYVASRDLRAILDRMRGNGQLMSISQAAYITSKVCEGLDYAHKRRDGTGAAMNIIHRDVSPQNILIGFEGEVKVIDFGIAKAANRASKTQAGVLKGKFGYMSPEQVRGLPTDRRSDIFAVGVLLYEMLTGERLFIGESDFSTLERVRNAEVTPPTKFNKKITPRLEEVVLRALAREVEDRYQWSSDLADDLQPFLKEDAKTVFNMKKLSVLMRDTYAGEISAEKQKLEEFLRVNAEDAKPERGSQHAASSVLPLHTPAVVAKPPPPTRAMTPGRGLDPSFEEGPDAFEGDSADEAGGFGEDKTFVIEASNAGLALQATQAPGPGSVDPRAETSLGDEIAPVPSSRPSSKAPAGSGRMATPPRSNASSKSMTAPRGEPRPATDNQGFLEQVSLYGDESAESDDSRTQVSAHNPFLKPSGGGGTDESDSDSDIDASEIDDPDPAPSPPPRFGSNATREQHEDISDAPTMAAAASDAVKDAINAERQRDAARARDRTGAAGRALDPVAAAMDEEERLALEILKGTTGGRGASSPQAAAPGGAARGDDFAGRQVPVTSSGARDQTELGPPIATETAAEAGALPSFEGAAHTPSLGQRAHRPVPAAVSPQMLRLIYGATAASALIFLVVATAVVLKLPARSTLVLYAVGDVQPESDVVIRVDGAEVARALPAQFDVGAGAHTLRIEGKGVLPVERPLKMTSGAMKQPVLFAAVPLPTPPVVHPAGTADKEPDKPALATGPGDPAPTGEPTTAPEATGPKLAMRVPPPVVGGWRLSLAAVADDTGRPISGAEVFIDNEPYGAVPFEAEIDPKREKVEVRVRAAGFESRSIDVQRGGREAVGPATVRLVPSKGAAPSPDVPPPVDAQPSDSAPPTGAATSSQPKPGDPAPTSTGAPPVAAREPAPASASDPGTSASPKPVATERPPPDKPAATARPATEKPPTDKPAAPRQKLAKLQIGSRPTMQVTLDGKNMGTKLFYGTDALPLSVGSHTIELFDPKTKKKHRLKVQISADDPGNKIVFDGSATPPGVKASGAVTVKLQ